MAQISTYSMLNVAATLDDMTIIGLFDGDDAVTVTQGADVGEMLVGADGSAIFSQSADLTVRISIKLQHTSPTHRQLTEKWLKQRGGQFVGFSFDVIDGGSGEGGTAAPCFIAQAPVDSKGQKATVREWVLAAGEWTPTVPNNR